MLTDLAAPVHVARSLGSGGCARKSGVERARIALASPPGPDGDRLAERAAKMRKRSDWLRGYLYTNLKASGQTKVDSPEFTISIRKNPPAVQIADGRTSTYFLTTFGRASRDTVCSCEVRLEPTLSQSLHLMNGDTVGPRIQQGGLVARMLRPGRLAPLMA